MVQIVCVNKGFGNHANPHLAISALGWVNPSTGKRGKSTRAEMVAFLEAGNNAYTQDAFGNKAWLQVCVSVLGNKFVRTYADKTPTDNLLYLGECPVFV